MKNIDLRVWIKGAGAVATAVMAALAAGATPMGAALAGVGALVLYLDKTVGDAAAAAKQAAAPATPSEVASELLHTAAGLMTQAAAMHAKAADVATSSATRSFGGGVPVTAEAVQSIVNAAVAPVAEQAAAAVSGELAGRVNGPDATRAMLTQAVAHPATVEALAAALAPKLAQVLPEVVSGSQP